MCRQFYSGRFESVIILNKLLCIYWLISKHDKIAENNSMRDISLKI